LAENLKLLSHCIIRARNIVNIMMGIGTTAEELSLAESYSGVRKWFIGEN